MFEFFMYIMIAWGIMSLVVYMCLKLYFRNVMITVNDDGKLDFTDISALNESGWGSKEK